MDQETKKIIFVIGFFTLSLWYVKTWFNAHEWQGPVEERFIDHRLP